MSFLATVKALTQAGCQVIPNYFNVYISIIKIYHVYNMKFSFFSVWGNATSIKNTLFCLFYRMTLLFFCLSGLDVLNSLDLTESRKKEIIDWIYAQQILPDPNNGDLIRDTIA